MESGEIRELLYITLLITIFSFLPLKGEKYLTKFDNGEHVIMSMESGEINDVNKQNKQDEQTDENEVTKPNETNEQKEEDLADYERPEIVTLPPPTDGDWGDIED